MGLGFKLLIGEASPTQLSFTMSADKWVAVLYSGTQAGIGAWETGTNLSNGKFGFKDIFNLLPLIFYAASGVSKALATARGVDGPLRTWGEIAVEPSCFVAGTEILTTEGEKSIEEIQVGDWVIADDPTTPGDIEARQVLETFVRHTDTLVDLYVDGEVISTTKEHPFWTPDKGWVEAKDLHVGSVLQTEDGRIIDVDKVEKREGSFTVYNFKVEGWHTYYVSDLGVLVHNADCGGQNYKQGGKYTEPTLPDKVIAQQGEVKVVHNYRGNDHPPAHVHVLGGGSETRIKLNGQPMPGDLPPTSQQQKLIDDNSPAIKSALRKIVNWLKFNDVPD